MDQNKNETPETLKNKPEPQNNTIGETISTPEQEEKLYLTPQQEEFIQLYCKDELHRGNATECYNIAYNHKLEEIQRNTPEYKALEHTCASSGWRLLRLDKIDKRKIQILNEMLNDRQVDSQLAKLINKGDIQAIREYNKLKQRITDKAEINVKADIIIESVNYADKAENKG